MSIANKTPTIRESLQANMAAAPDEDVALVAGDEPEVTTPVVEPAEQAEPVEAPAGDEPAPAEPAAGEESVQAQRARDANGKFTAKQKSEKAAADKKASEAKDPLPEGLSPQLGSHWGKLPAEVKNEFKRMATDSTAAVQKANSELNFAKQRTQALDPVLKPLEEAAAAQGVYVPQVLHNYINWGMFIEKNPQQAIAQLAQKYGVNLNAPAQGQLDPSVQALVAQEVARRTAPVLSQVQSYEQQAQQAKVAQATQTLSQFSAATNPSGTPLRPHFAKVLPVMNSLYAVTKQANPQASEEQILQATYDAACATVPDIRREMAQAEFGAAEAARKAEAAERARKAKAAMSPASSPPAGSGAARNGAQSRTDSIATQVAKFYSNGGDRIS